MSDVKYTKLKDLVDSSFTVEKVWGYKFKSWDKENSKMIVKDQWFEGCRKVYQVDTNRGKLDLGTQQLGGMFESVQHAGEANINGVTFEVKSNGKSGIDIRYYLNPVRMDKSEPEDKQVEKTPEGLDF